MDRHTYTIWMDTGSARPYGLKIIAGGLRRTNERSRFVWNSTGHIIYKSRIWARLSNNSPPAKLLHFTRTKRSTNCYVMHRDLSGIPRCNTLSFGLLWGLLLSRSEYVWVASEVCGRAREQVCSINIWTNFVAPCCQLAKLNRFQHVLDVRPFSVMILISESIECL